MIRSLLETTAENAIDYLEAVHDRRVAPTPEAVAALSALGGPLPETSSDPDEVIALLNYLGGPATVASTGGRFFGFVIGGTLPVALAANWLAGTWDQNAGLLAASPVATIVEEIARDWLLDMLGLPPTAGIGFVTGGTMANFTSLASARHALLQKVGWNVEEQGLFDAPPITVVVGDEGHVTLFKSLSMLGMGRSRVIRVPVDNQGRMRADQLPPLNETTLLCLQAGNVNTGAFDPFSEIIPRAREAGAWVHIDGAFGLWVAASPAYHELMRGYTDADSWSVDAHKWLNVPYDSGIAISRDPQAMRGAMSTAASYLVESDHREPSHYTPELSRRARGIEIWAALRSLGRSGFIEIVERNCRQAQRFADGLRAAGFTILNDVVINQVLVSFGDADRTRRVIAAAQREGTAWFGGTVWQGHTAMRISVSGWSTTDADIDQSVAALVRLAAEA